MNPMFGESAEITRAGLETAATAGLDLDRLAQSILTPSEWAEYERVRVGSFTVALDRDGLALFTDKNKEHDRIRILASALSGALGLPPSETEV